jgi:hypothetical protein
MAMKHASAIPAPPANEANTHVGGAVGSNSRLNTPARNANENPIC